MAADDYLIRQYAKARDAGDIEAAMVFWEDACVRNRDLLESEIRRFRFPGTSTPLKEQDRGEALTRALQRSLRMGYRFEGHCGPEFRAALMTAAYRGCQDVGREEMAHEKRSGGSLDERYEDSDGSRFDKLVETYLREQEILAGEADDDAAAAERAVALVHWAIPRVKNEKYRTVLELTFNEKLSGEQIAERLNITVANVYQRRKRGQNELEKILRDHRS